MDAAAKVLWEGSRVAREVIMEPRQPITLWGGMESSSSVLLSGLPKTQPSSMSQLLHFFPSAQQECKAKGESANLYAADIDVP